MSFSASISFVGAYDVISPSDIQLHDFGGTVVATATVSGLSPSIIPTDYIVYTWSRNNVVFRTTQVPATTTSDTTDPISFGYYTLGVVHYYTTGEGLASESYQTNFQIYNSDQPMFQITVSQSNTPLTQSGEESNVRVVCDDINYITVTQGEVIVGLIKCFDGKFYMYISDIVEVATYPLILTINNTYTGEYYTFIIGSSSVVSGIYSIPVGLDGGNYYVTLTDAVGLTQAISFTISRPSINGVEITPCDQSLSCTDGNTGTLTATVRKETESGPFWCDTPQYSYRWTYNCQEYDPITNMNVAEPVWTIPEDAPYTSMTINNLTAGYYCVFVKEICSQRQCSLESCSLNACAKINQPTAINIKICPNKLNLDCYGDTDGSISVWTVGGISPYTYTLNLLTELGPPQHVAGPQPSDVFTDLSFGDYQVVVTDANNCTATETFSITQPLPVTVTIITLSDECGTKLKATATGGTICGCTNSCNRSNNNNRKKPVNDSYRYEWINTRTPDNIICTSSCTGFLDPGVYIVTAYDSKCCSGEAIAEIVCTKMCVKVKKINNDSCSFRVNVCVSNGCHPYKYEVNGSCLDDDIEQYDFRISDQFVLKVTDSKGNIVTTTF